MSVYSVRELFDILHNRMMSGECQPDDKLLITIWTADHGQEWRNQRMTEREWSDFLSDLEHWQHEFLRNDQASSLHLWLRESDPARHAVSSQV